MDKDAARPRAVKLAEKHRLPRPQPKLTIVDDHLFARPTSDDLTWASCCIRSGGIRPMGGIRASSAAEYRAAHRGRRSHRWDTPVVSDRSPSLFPTDPLSDTASAACAVISIIWFRRLVERKCHFQMFSGVSLPTSVRRLDADNSLSPCRIVRAVWSQAKDASVDSRLPPSAPDTPK